MKYTWEQLEKDVRVLSKKIGSYDFIIGIPRGGLTLAVMLSYSKNIPLLTSIRGIKNKRVLLVDEISDTGNTLKRVKKELNSQNNIVETLTIHIQKETALVPDYYIAVTNEWIDYPWEG